MTIAYGTIVLAGGDASLTLVPELGGKLTSLRLGGREWLWTNDLLPRRASGERAPPAPADDDAWYARTADTGGFDECFPTVGACVLPAGVVGGGPLRLTDHGELWWRQPRTLRHETEGVERVACSWTGHRLPYTFSRDLMVHPDGRVEMRYVATNTGSTPIPFLWAAHPLLPLTDRTRLLLPVGARVRVAAAHGIHLDAPPAEHAWPMVAMDGTTLDFSRPAAAAADYACKLFLDLPRGRVRLSVQEQDARLDVTMDGDEVTHCGLWLNNRGWTPSPERGPYRNLAVEPCIGAPDSLREALEQWDAAAWLPPGESRRWMVVWSGERRR